MAELDFTALNKLAYRGFETVEEQEQKDALIEQGFTIAEDKDNPFLKDAPTASQTALEPPQASALSISTSASFFIDSAVTTHGLCMASLLAKTI